MKRMSKWWRDLMRRGRRREAERIKRAGPHVCQAECCATSALLTGRGDRTLTRPAVMLTPYECKVCGRAMKKGRSR